MSPGWPILSRYFAKGWAFPTPDPARVELLLGCRPDFQDGQGPLIDFHSAFFPVGIAAETAPLPLLRLQHQTALHRIAVHVA